MSSQDVLTAFDAMKHKLILQALLARGVSHSLAGISMQELVVISACMHIP